MFVDQADIEIQAGDGGRGAVSFRKEKYIPHGGPDGGDGGDGGSVYIEATPGVDTLLDMTGRHHWHAQSGEKGLGKKMAGRDGEDLVIHVPPGTLVYDRTSAILLADLKTPGQRVCLAKGGRGGKGNTNFTTSVRQAPDFAEPGQKGQARSLHLELRLIADVGIVGLPNAGKSTLLSRLSAARPKIADYPFTTLVPQLGIADVDGTGRGGGGRRLVLADIPGLIEGASQGAGLGLDFLRHIERTRVLVHIIDILPLDGSSPIDTYRQIRGELQAYSPRLAAKPEILVANKMDLEGASEALADLRQALPGKQIYAISAVAGSGLRPLLEAVWQQAKNAPESAPLVEDRPYVPPTQAKQRSEAEMFPVADGEADESAWVPVDGDLEALVPLADDKPDVFIDATGAKAAGPKEHKKAAQRTPRTRIEPVHAGKKSKGRRTAKQRKAVHDAKLRKQKTPPRGESTPAELDAALAAEIAAIKADDARKGIYYNRKKRNL
jgi:GTPase